MITKNAVEDALKPLSMLNEAAFRMGRLSARSEQIAEEFHTCDQSYLRHPWPPQQGCPGCEHEIQKWVQRLHLEMPYRLFGWQCVVDEADRAIQRKMDRAEACRNRGANI